MEKVLENLSLILTNNIFFAPTISFIAGVLVSFTPCFLLQLPIFFTYIYGVENNKESNNKNKIINTLWYCFGNIFIFVILAILIKFIGKIINFNSHIWYIFLGTLMIILFFYMIDIFKINKCKVIQKIKISKNSKINAIFYGIIGGIFSSPCATPVLISILALISINNNLVIGIVSLIFYSIGNNVLILILGSFTALFNKITENKKLDKLSKILKSVLAIFILAIGVYMFYLGF